MQITLFDRNPKICDQWSKDFKGYEEIQVIHSDFESLRSHDCIVSPANSFGLMDGGFDLIIRNTIEGIEKKVQNKVNSEYGGIQPVGTCLIVPTGYGKFPYLAHTPTMIRPGDISNTINIFLAFRSLLHNVKKHKYISSIACNGLGYGTGCMSAHDVSKQMKLAYDTQNDSYTDWYLVSRLLDSF